MGVATAAEIDAWLRQGGLVVTASERAARALTQEFHLARQAEGLKAWVSPGIRDWNGFIRWAWTMHSLDGRLVLNRAQEQSVWAEIASRDAELATLLEGPRYRLAALAMDAHDLLCSFAPRYLRAAARAGWQQDAASFSRWLMAFDETCKSKNLVSATRLPIELLSLLREGSEERPPILLVGFDRILPAQREVLEAWGQFREAQRGEAASDITFHEAPHERAELTACVRWCHNKLASEPVCRILVVTQELGNRRGEIERAFLTADDRDPLPFEFSLGIPLGQAELPHAMLLLLRWLTTPLIENQLDWLIATGLVTDPAETVALERQMLYLRKRGLQQPEWTLRKFLQLLPQDPVAGGQLKAWSARMADAQRKLGQLARLPQYPLDWAEAVPQLLDTMLFGSARALSSAEHQVADRCRQALETAASLGFDGRRVDWKEFLSFFARMLEEMLFAPESENAPILILGAAESAGLRADAVWFLGTTEDGWPARGATNPLLPLEVQRETQMPHATPQVDWELARTMTARLVASTHEVHFSFARQVEGTEKRASRIAVQFAGDAKALNEHIFNEERGEALANWAEDSGPIPYPSDRLHGGARVLTYQSQCPFKAFAAARLGAEGWDSAEAGLSPPQRGQLLHEVLHAIWSGPPEGIRSHSDIPTEDNLEAFVTHHVRCAFAVKLDASVRERMPGRYLQAEERRLVRLVNEWMQFDAARIPFEVLQTEVERDVEVTGLSFKVRLDRLDLLNDGSVLVVDYKSGDVKAKSWDLPRPDDIQLPLYATFALGDELQPGGLVFAKVRAGNVCFAGSVGNAKETLLAGLNARSSLVASPLGVEMLEGWRNLIEELARDFIAGRAEVSPREVPDTCDRCGLHTICRIHERQTQVADATGESETTDG